MTRFDIAQLLSLIRFDVCNPISDLERLNDLHQYQKLFTSFSPVSTRMACFQQKKENK